MSSIRTFLWSNFFLLYLYISPAHAQSTWVDSTFQRMSMDEKIGQLFMIAAYSNRDVAYEKQLEATLKKYHIGGLIFFQGILLKQAQMTNRFQAISPVPLMIGMDAESGIGMRVKQALEFPNQTLLGAIQNQDIIYRIGEAIGQDCRLLGVHVNFAPVVDININPKNPVIGIRAFGEDKRQVSEKAIAYMQGLRAQNVMAVAKHFPGHGDTETDSHLALPTIKHTESRLDSIELYPFKQLICSGLPAMMISHLHVPAYDTSAIPATLSFPIVTQLLREKLMFKGLCFTDAMNMKGVTQGRDKGVGEVQALLAGNDILLFPEDIASAVKKIKEALKKGQLSPSLIDERCKRILAAKEKYVLPYNTPIDTVSLLQRMNTPQDSSLWESTYAAAITLVKNNNQLLPLRRLDTLKIASVNFGDQTITPFTEILSRYTTCTHFSLKKDAPQTTVNQLLKQLSRYNCIIIYNSAARNSAARQFGVSTQLVNFIKSLTGKRIILCHPATPYGLDLYSHLPLDALLVSYSHDKPALQFAAQAIFGGIKVNGKLPVSINHTYPAGIGLSTPKIRLGYQHPESNDMNSRVLQKIDSLCQDAIQQRATPGCQVLVAKDGYVIYNKAFGYHTYKKQRPNQVNDIYDIASVTKITATLPAVMMLYDEQKIALDIPIARYYSRLKETNKANMTIRELLLHMAALKPAFSFFAHAIDYDKLQGRLFSTRPTANNRKKLRDRLYVNTHFQYKDSTFCFEKRNGYQLVCPNFYMHTSFRDSIHELLLNTPLLPQKKYAYSDIGFVLLKDILEEQTGIRFQTFCKKQLWERLGTNDTDFSAHRTLDINRLVPSCQDNLFRKSFIKGYVHDPIALLLGGVSGNAGLFSTANDLAKIMCMYLNHGKYGGEHFIDSTTITLFSSRQLHPSKNRRGLGFDKPEPDTLRNGPTTPKASVSSYGHTGFTGTMVWNDPEHQIIYIFLSNRTFPNEYNDELIKQGYRTKIQEVIYNAIRPTKIIK